jgi:predicted protein tyrosine phosphatase
MKYIAKNPFQGPHKKVLCVCSVGLLRSPTVALVLSMPPYNFNTRAVGFDVGCALIPITDILLEWAHEVVCMDEYQKTEIQKKTDKPVFNLALSDMFDYRDEKLMDIVPYRYNKAITNLTKE